MHGPSGEWSGRPSGALRAIDASARPRSRRTRGPYLSSGFRSPRARRRAGRRTAGLATTPASSPSPYPTTRSLAGIVSWRAWRPAGLMAAVQRSALCSSPSTAVRASGPPPNGCSPSTCSRPLWWTASRPSPTSRTWPSSGHWSASGSAARASCVASPSTVDAGTTKCSTPAFETIPPDRRSTSPSTQAIYWLAAPG